MSSTKKRRKAAPAAQQPEDASDVLPEEEQWRLINETGILQQIATPSASSAQAEAPVEMPLFDAFILLIPFLFLYLLMDILIHQQYGQHPTFGEEISRLSSAAPILALFVYHSARTSARSTFRNQLAANTRKKRIWIQALLFCLGVACGCGLVFHLNTSPWKTVMRQAPPLATLWVYTILQLRLELAVLSLVAVYAWLWFKGLKIIL